MELNAQIFAKESEIELKKKEMKIKTIEMEKLAIYISEKNSFLEEFKEIVENLKKSKGIDDRELIFKKLVSFTSEKFKTGDAAINYILDKLTSTQTKEFIKYIQNLGFKIFAINSWKILNNYY